MVPTLMMGFRISVLLRVGGPRFRSDPHGPSARRFAGAARKQFGPRDAGHGALLESDAQALETHASRAARTEPQHDDDDDDERNMWRRILGTKPATVNRRFATTRRESRSLRRQT